MTVDCPTCGAPAEVHPSGEVGAAIGDTTVRLLGAPVSRCVAGHLHPWPTDLATRATARVEEFLLSADRRGLRRRDHCGACGAVLSMPPRHTDTPVSLPLPGHVVTIIVESQMGRCPDCGAEQLSSTDADAVGPIIAAALDRIAEHG